MPALPAIAPRNWPTVMSRPPAGKLSPKSKYTMLVSTTRFSSGSTASRRGRL
jgi:hypothetical protein